MLLESCSVMVRRFTVVASSDMFSSTGSGMLQFTSSLGPCVLNRLSNSSHCERSFSAFTQKPYCG